MADAWWKGAVLGCAVVGALVAGAGAVHSVGAWNTAWRERGGPDARLSLMLALGWTLMAAGSALLVAAYRMQKGERVAADLAFAAAGFLAVLFALLAYALSWWPLVLPAALVGTLWVARRRKPHAT